MTTYFKYIVISLALINLLGSCEIEKIKPINALTEENVITNVETAQSMLNSVYAETRGEGASSMSGYVIEALGDGLNFLSGNFGVSGMDINDVRDDNQFASSVYPEQYTVINQANWLISLLEQGKAKGISETRKNEMIAEAKCLRAFAHFNLLRLFGQFYDLSSQYGIVIRTKPARGPEISHRNSVKESYDTIVSDLKFAKEFGPTGVPHWRVSSTTASALLSKVYLYMGDFQAASTESLAVIQNTDGYLLEPTYDKIFQNRFDSKETFFSPFVDGLMERCFTYIGAAISTYSSYLYSLADESVTGVGDLNGNGSGFDPRFSYMYSENTKGYQNGKCPFPNTDLNNIDAAGNTFYPLRMAEIYLIYAEAQARTSSGISIEAVDKVNEIRLRAGANLSPIAPANKHDLLMNIYNEKLMELIGENGEHWFDMVRYDRLGDIKIQDYKATITNSDKLIMPIPRTALAGNKLLTQNPGY